jgi:polar amino acid transport system permease protein
LSYSFQFTVSPFLWRGAWLAVEITALAMAGGLVCGLPLVLLRLSSFAAFRALAWF